MTLRLPGSCRLGRRTTRSVPRVVLTALLWSGVALVDPGARAQDAVEPVDTTIIASIRNEGLNRSHIFDDLRHLTDVIGPRLTGSPAMDRANEWTAGKMREYGLDSVHLEGWPFGRGWEELFYSGRMTAPFVRPLHGRAVAWSGSTDGPESGQAVFLGSITIDELSLHRERLQGAWVLLDSAETTRRLIRPRGAGRWTEDEVRERFVEVPWSEDERRQANERDRRLYDLHLKLAEFGVRGILHRSLFPEGTLGWVESVIGEGIPPEILEPGAAEPLPNVILSDADYGLIYRNLMEGVPVSLEFDLRNRFVEDDPTVYNTIGEITGTDLGDEIVFIGAHLDSWPGGTGAIDNGAGAIVVMEAMRILSAIGATPRRTIRVGLWNGEEPEEPVYGGLRGSRAYVEAHADEMDRITAYFNVDQGTGRIRGIWEQNRPEAASVIAGIMRPLADLGVVGMKPGFFVGSDERPFAAVGVPAFPFVHDHVTNHLIHSDADTFEAVSIEELQQTAVVVAVVAYHLATREERLPR